MEPWELAPLDVMVDYEWRRENTKREGKKSVKKKEKNGEGFLVGR